MGKGEIHCDVTGLLWKGSIALAQFLHRHSESLRHLRCLELGSGCGAVAVYAKRFLGFEEIITSDISPEDGDEGANSEQAENCQREGEKKAFQPIRRDIVEENIIRNAELNGLKEWKHVAHTWGHHVEEFVSQIGITLFFPHRLSHIHRVSKTHSHSYILQETSTCFWGQTS
jgi:hypothetical protein